MNTQELQKLQDEFGTAGRPARGVTAQIFKVEFGLHPLTKPNVRYILGAETNTSQ